jgi:hypothetical protein
MVMVSQLTKQNSLRRQISVTTMTLQSQGIRIYGQELLLKRGGKALFTRYKQILSHAITGMPSQFRGSYWERFFPRLSGRLSHCHLPEKSGCTERKTSCLNFHVSFLKIWLYDAAFKLTAKAKWRSMHALSSSGGCDSSNLHRVKCNIN